jgi:hypothetical protein
MPKNHQPRPHSEIRDALDGLTVPIWPTAAQALGLGRNAAYEAAKRGEIPTIALGRRKPVPTSWLRRVLGIEEQHHGPEQ